MTMRIMRKILDFIGILMIALGVSLDGFECFVISIVLMAIGFILMGFVERS